MNTLQYLKMKVFSLLPLNMQKNFLAFMAYNKFAIDEPTLTFSTIKFLLWRPLLHISGKKDSKYCCYIESSICTKFFLDLLELQHEEFSNRAVKEESLFSPLFTIGHLARLQQLKSTKIFLHSYEHDEANVFLNHVYMYLDEHNKLVINETEEVIKDDQFDPLVIAPKEHWKPGYYFLIDENGNKISDEHPIYY